MKVVLFGGQGCVRIFLCDPKPMVPVGNRPISGI